MSINNVLTNSNFWPASSSCFFPVCKPSKCPGIKWLEMNSLLAWQLDTLTLFFLTFSICLDMTAFRFVHCKPSKEGNMSSEDDEHEVNFIFVLNWEWQICLRNLYNLHTFCKITRCSSQVHHEGSMRISLNKLFCLEVETIFLMCSNQTWDINYLELEHESLTSIQLYLGLCFLLNQWIAHLFLLPQNMFFPIFLLSSIEHFQLTINHSSLPTH